MTPVPRTKTACPRRLVDREFATWRKRRKNCSRSAGSRARIAADARPRRASITMAKKPASPTADVETQSERIKNLSLQDVDTLVERQRRIEVELKHLAEELKITVQDADYAKAAKIQAEEASLHAETHDIREARAIISRLKKQRAREAAGATQTLPPRLPCARTPSPFGTRVSRRCSPPRARRRNHPRHHRRRSQARRRRGHDRHPPPRPSRRRFHPQRPLRPRGGPSANKHRLRGITRCTTTTRARTTPMSITMKSTRSASRVFSPRSSSWSTSTSAGFPSGRPSATMRTPEIRTGTSRNHRGFRRRGRAGRLRHARVQLRRRGSAQQQ